MAGRKIKVFDIQGNFIKEFPTLTKCAIFFNIHHSTLIKRLKNTLFNHKNYMFFYSIPKRVSVKKNKKEKIKIEHAKIYIQGSWPIRATNHQTGIPIKQLEDFADKIGYEVKNGQFREKEK